MRKTTILTLSLMMIAAGLMAEVTVPYGEGAGKADYINYKRYPKCDDPQPTGPLSFRVTGDSVWVADSVRSKLMQFDKSGKFISEFNTYPKGEKAFATEKQGDDTLPILFRTIDDFAPVYGEDGKVVSFWVIDSCKNVVANYAVDGTKLNEFKHNEFGQLSRIEVGLGGHIFVADKVAQAIFTFDAEGNFCNKQPWEWSGFAVSGKDDILYRLIYNAENHMNYLAITTVDGKEIQGAPIQKNLFDPRLWWVDESKGECVIIHSPAEFKGNYNVLRAGLNGKVIAEGEMPAPMIMNRYIDYSNGEVFIGKGNYFDAPEGNFGVIPFELPKPAK